MEGVLDRMGARDRGAVDGERAYVFVLVERWLEVVRGVRDAEEEDGD